MKKTILHLPISPDSCIQLTLPCNEKDLTFCDTITLSLMHLSHETILYDGCSSMALHDLHDFLRQINGKLMLHTSIKKNIGFLWNEYLQDKTDSTFVFEDVEGRPSWIGQKYLLWESNTSNCATWLYCRNNTFF